MNKFENWEVKVIGYCDRVEDRLGRSGDFWVLGCKMGG